MGVIYSVNQKHGFSEDVPVYTQPVNALIDAILVQYSALIADVTEGRVPEAVLREAIERTVAETKGLYDPEGVKKLVFDTLYGYGLIQSLVEDPDISDIDIPRYRCVLAKKRGVCYETGLRFDSEEDFQRFCKLIIIRNGGILNDVDTHCRVSDVSRRLRINACIPPRNTLGASLSIRKHVEHAFTYEALVQMGYLDPQSAHILKQLNDAGENLIICGKGAAGKTTLLRTLIENGDNLERVLICESDAELYPQKQNVIAQSLGKKSTVEQIDALDTLIREGLTMSLDTYCIGEITGKEAWPLIKAGFTGHRILATLHASSAEDALDRLLMLIEGSTQLSQGQLMHMIRRAARVIVYVRSFSVETIIRIDSSDQMDSSTQTGFSSSFERLYHKEAPPHVPIGCVCPK